MTANIMKSFDCANGILYSDFIDFTTLYDA